MNNKILNINEEEINPDFVYMIIPSEYVCVYHKLLVMMSDFGLQMLYDCNSGCKSSNKTLVNCWNMFQTACAAYQIGKLKESNVLISYIKETINTIYKGTGVTQIGNIILPITVDGEVKAIIKCGDNPEFIPDDNNCSSINVVQELGDSTEDVMSQNAVTTEVNKLITDIVKNHIEINLYSSPSFIERGIDKEITLSWTTKYNDENIIPDKIAIKHNNSILLDDINLKSIKGIINNTTIFNLEVEYKNAIVQKDLTVKAYWPIYVNMSLNEILTKEDIINFGNTGKYVKSSAIGTYEVVPTEFSYVWICVPTDFNVINPNNIKSSNQVFPVKQFDNNHYLTIQINNKVYRCYRSTYLLYDKKITIQIV